VEISESLPLQPLWWMNSGLSSPSRGRWRHNGDLGALLFQVCIPLSLYANKKKKKAGAYKLLDIFWEISLFISYDMNSL
jgi:hypothetical protein